MAPGQKVIMADKEKLNYGNGKDVRKLRFPVAWVWVIVLAVAGIAITTTGMIARAQAGADRANTRVDGIADRLDKIENKQDQMLEILLQSKNLSFPRRRESRINTEGTEEK